MICRLHWMHWPAGLRSGVSPLGLGRPRPLLWCLAHDVMFPPCSVTLASAPLPVVFECPCQGVILTPSLSWTPHLNLVSRGNRQFAQCVPCCKSERPPFAVGVHALHFLRVAEHILGSEFLISSPPALRLLNSALQCWGRFLLGWPPGSPIASVFLELGWPEAEHFTTGRLLSLSGARNAFLRPVSASCIDLQSRINSPRILAG